MKALILAAGYGKRLQPITNVIPKSMVEVNGTPLLINALNNLVSLRINDIGIVVGHMSEYIKEHVGVEYRGAKISYFENERYLETNNVVSLYKACDFCDDDMLMLECDIYYHREILVDMVAVLFNDTDKCIQGLIDGLVLAGPGFVHVFDGN